MPAGRLEVEISGRMEKLEGALRRAESEAKRTGDTLDKTLNTPSAKLAMNMGKIFAAMGFVELATKSASAGFSALQGLSESFAGNTEEAAKHWEATAETVKTLPMGLGPVAAAIEQILFNVSGLQTKLDEIAGKEAEIAQIDQLIQSIKQRKAVNASLEKQLQIMKETDPVKKADLKFREKESALIAKLMAEVEKYNKKRSEGGNPQIVRELTRELRLRQQILEEENRRERQRAKELRSQEEKNRLLAKQAELTAAQQKDEAKMFELRNRLGAAGTMDQPKRGLLKTAQTAMGSFAFGEQNHQQKVQILMKQQETIQQAIRQRVAVLEQLVRTLTQRIGFS